MTPLQNHGRRALAAATLAAVALVAAACGSGGASPTTTTSSPASGGSTGGSNAGTGATTAALVKTATVAKVGKVLVDKQGFTLYVHKTDPKNKSVCTGSCSALWPPLTVTSMSEKISSMPGFGVIHRTGGVLQVTYKGHPLYTYKGDTAPGQANGEGFGGIWYVVKTSSSGSGGSGSSGGGYGGGGGW
jgi:predicted lipoprotein with Yx(FWY)xxD motif